MMLRDYIIGLTVRVYRLDESKKGGHMAAFTLDLLGDIEPTIDSIRFWYGSVDNLTISDYRQKIYEGRKVLSNIANEITVRDIREAIGELEKSLAEEDSNFYETLRSKLFFVQDSDCYFKVFLYCEREDENQ